MPEFEEFLPSWITYLGDKMGHDADRLILEAVDLLNDISLELQYAETYASGEYGIYRTQSDEDDTKEIYCAKPGGFGNGRVCHGSGMKREELQRLLKAFPVGKDDGSYTLYDKNFCYGRELYFERGKQAGQKYGFDDQVLRRAVCGGIGQRIA